jgi:L-2-hydroxyglutarate oxidase LhgO
MLDPDAQAISLPGQTSASEASGSYNVAIVGGGIVGLAAGLQLLRARPRLRLIIIEREADLATHQSGHNSGVLHAGLYYRPGSLKAQLCLDGKAELEPYLQERSIPFRRIGKLVVATREAELDGLQAIYERATTNGVPGLAMIAPERMHELEPHLTGLRAIWSPMTGIVDFRAVALAYAEDIRQAGGAIVVNSPVMSITERADGVILTTPGGEIRASTVLTCAGLHSDRVARLTSGDRDAPAIVPFRGDYYTLTPGASHLVQRLIYPVPDPKLPFLGVHFTPRMDGTVWAGPNAVLALSRHGYRRRDISMRDTWATVRHAGFRRLARRHLRSGVAEAWRDVSKRAFLRDLRRYIPELRRSDLRFGPSGVRAQAVDSAGNLVDDFDIVDSRRIVHVRNAPSPAATASLAIGRTLADRAIERFDL